MIVIVVALLVVAWLVVTRLIVALVLVVALGAVWLRLIRSVIVGIVMGFWVY